MTSGDRLRLSLRGLAIGEVLGRVRTFAEITVDAPLTDSSGEISNAAFELAASLARDAAATDARPSSAAASLALGPLLGAYFAEDEAALWQAAESIARSNDPNLLAGTIALALAAAWAARYAEHAGAAARAISDDRRRFLVWIRDRLPEGAVRACLELAVQTPLEGMPRDAAARLRTGARPAVAEEVAFVLWCVARHLEGFVPALLAVRELVPASAEAPASEAPTPDPLVAESCAAAGAIVALSAGESSIPAAWLAAVPPLPAEVVALP